MQVRETFQSPYNEYKERVGQPFKDLGITDCDGTETTVIVHKIEFEDGTQIWAWPEEIYKGIGWEP